MNKRILWIEDDYYAIKGLVKPLENEGFIVDIAVDGIEAYKKLDDLQAYNLIVVDLIIPLSDYDGEVCPADVLIWDEEEYLGIGLVKWLVNSQKVTCPILLLSVIRNPIADYQLNTCGSLYQLSKSGLLPSKLKETVQQILKVN